jgi:predicted dinucleotide-binding enzyme
LPSGLRPVDCGPLETARIVEQLTPLIIAINIRHKVTAGIKITRPNGDLW